MDKDMLTNVKLLGVSFFALTVLLSLIFFNSGFIVILRMLLAIYWVLILPGFVLSHIIPIDFHAERIIVSVAISAAIIGVMAYYLAILGVDILYLAYALPLVILLAAVFVSLFCKR